MQELIKFVAWDTEQINHLLKFGIPLLDLNAFDVTYIPEKIVSETLIRRHQVLPLFKRGQQLYLAMTDPGNQSVLDEIKFHTGLMTYSIAVESAKLTKLIDLVLDQKDIVLDALHSIAGQDTENDEIGREAERDDAPIVSFVRHILLNAIKKGASDIHFEPYEQTYRVRYRQDGILYPIATPPLSLGGHIASRIKVMSQLDIAERRMPQDGRFKLTLTSRKKAVDFRISTCPTVNGEKIVMRILDSSIATVEIDTLGYESFQKDIFLSALQKPQGMILVTGPTGSGKTLSLYTALKILNKPEVNISTVEDPVEIHLEGINQVNINLKTGFTFATALKTFLRQDPDIIMVGEMRDFETADIGVKAAQTGHLVLSTLHTNSAAETITRLMHMGIAPYNIATSITLVIAQRLIRKLCPACKRPDDMSADGFYIPVGCEQCYQGYKGRTGIYELLPMTSTLSEAILQGASSLEINRLALQSGMQSLHSSALNKARAGITSLAEIHRVT
jgi:type IV pilus assembly protein PilB